MFIVGAFAIILDDQGRVLLSHRRDMDAWNLPGGGLEPGELPNEAAIRETREETGLQVAMERLVGVYGKEGGDELVFAFACAVISGALAATDEADDNRFFPAEALPPNTIPKHVERIRDALAGGPPVVRRQLGPSTREWLASRPQNPKGGIGR